MFRVKHDHPARNFWWPVMSDEGIVSLKLRVSWTIPRQLRWPRDQNAQDEATGGRHSLGHWKLA